MAQQAVSKGGMALNVYLKRYSKENRFEIIDGKIVPTPLGVAGHGFTVNHLFRMLDACLKDDPIWDVYLGSGYVQFDRTRPDWLINALDSDIMLIRKADFEAYKAGHPNWRDSLPTLIPPFIADVIRQPGAYSAAPRKIRQYLTAGVQTVWLIDPFDRTVKVYRAGQDADHPDVLKESAALTTDLLPGFSLPLADLFAE